VSRQQSTENICIWEEQISVQIAIQEYWEVIIKGVVFFLAILIILGFLGAFVSAWFAPPGMILGLYLAITSIKGIDGVISFVGREY